MRLSLSVSGLAFVLSLAASPAFAIRPDEVLTNPKLEARARAIGQELRCLVCQNQSIDDSDADLAHDLRVLVRQRLLAGDSDSHVKAYIVARYGNYVLLKPPLIGETYFLWLGPSIFLLTAAGIAALYYRHREREPPSAPLSPAHHARVQTLIEGASRQDAV
jgi:cytochrome c-type biogenesis protein CcmH